jgi:hypothetical protein
MKKVLVVLLLVGYVLPGCTKITITGPSPNSTNSNTNNNTNTNTNNNTTNVTVDRTGSDTGPAPTGVVVDPNIITNGIIPLPNYGEPVTVKLASLNSNLLGLACNNWDFIDLVVRTLRAQDNRWGYLCKDEACITYGRDVIAYRASTGTTGIWIVDIINDICGGNSIQWLVHPFDLTRKWSANRTTGIF